MENDVLHRSVTLSYWRKDNLGTWERVTRTISTIKDFPLTNSEASAYGTTIEYVDGTNVSEPKKSKKTNSWKPKQYGRAR